jgi:tRNA(fMet)-specific endonuclease VapC
MYYLDSNICIDFLRGKKRTIEEHLLRLTPNQIKIPIIVKAELLYGIEKSNKKQENRIAYEKFIKAFEIINLDDEAIKQYSWIRLELEKGGNVIGSNDIFIAAIVIANNGILVTHNINEFSRISGLKYEDW